MPPDPTDTTIEYYDGNASAFIERTINVDLSDEYEAFLPHLPARGHILDAGCGSGRDARIFRDMGYQVTAFDGSIEMVRHASSHTGLDVEHLRFEEIAWEHEFDGAWASASLLHVPASQVLDAINRLARSLRTGGTFYMSMKHGTDEQCIEGRLFSFVDEARVQALIEQVTGLQLLRTWSSTEHRDDGTTQGWVHALACREQVELPPSKQ